MYLEKYDKSFETCKNNKENDIDKSNKENVHLKLTVTKNSRSESFGKFWRWLSQQKLWNMFWMNWRYNTTRKIKRYSFFSMSVVDVSGKKYQFRR